MPGLHEGRNTQLLAAGSSPHPLARSPTSLAGEADDVVSRSPTLATGEKKSLLKASRCDKLDLPIEVSIPRCDIEQATLSQRVLFVVEANGFGVKSVARHPFEEFESLYEWATSKATHFALPALPQNSWFGGFGAAKQDVAEDRRVRLEDLLRKMIMLQEIADHPDEEFWSFLQFPKPAVVAARFLVCDPKSRRHWLQELRTVSGSSHATQETVSEGSLPLQHPFVEAQLIQICCNAVNRPKVGNSRSEDMAEIYAGIADQVQQEAEELIKQASIACELLARIFIRTKQGRHHSFGKEPSRQHCIEVLLEVGQIDDPASPATEATSPQSASLLQPDEGNSESLTCRSLRESAMKALRALAELKAWSENLSGFLDDGGASQLAAAASSDTAGEGGRRPMQRAITEVILRGFEKPVIERLAASDRSKDRRKLLNALFTSGDTYVRVMVGLLLAGLLCEEGFEDARQADLGIQDILEDLQSEGRKLDDLAQDIGLCQFLLEPSIWRWLCTLVAAHRTCVNNFALLLINGILQQSLMGLKPDDVFEFTRFHERLMRLCEPEADPISRFYSSKILLSAYRGSSRSPPTRTALANLCSCLDINFQAKLEQDIGVQSMLGVEVSKSCTWVQAAAEVDEFIRQASEFNNNLQEETAEWRKSLDSAKDSVVRTHSCEMQVQNALQEYRTSIDAASATVGDIIRTDEEADMIAMLENAEALLAEREQNYKRSEAYATELAEEHKDYVQTLARHDEAAWEIQTRMSEAEENAQARSYDTVPGLVPYLKEESIRYTETQERSALMRVEAERLNERLSETCAPLPQNEADIVQDRELVKELRGRIHTMRDPSKAVGTWGTLLDRQKEVGRDIEGLQRSLQKVSGGVSSERVRRNILRASIQHMMASLTNLDSCLESLESWDSLGAEGNEGEFSPWYQETL